MQIYFFRLHTTRLLHIRLTETPLIVWQHISLFMPLVPQSSYASSRFLLSFFFTHCSHLSTYSITSRSSMLISIVYQNCFLKTFTFHHNMPLRNCQLFLEIGTSIHKKILRIFLSGGCYTYLEVLDQTLRSNGKTSKITLVSTFLKYQNQ